MKKLITIIISFILICVTAYFVSAEVFKDNSFVSYEEVVKREKMAIVYIYSDNCTYCHEFFPIYKDLSQEFKHKFLFSVINISDKKYYPLFKRLRVRSVPSIYLYNPKKQNLKYLSPYYYSEGQMRKFLTNYSLNK